MVDGEKKTIKDKVYIEIEKALMDAIAEKNKIEKEKDQLQASLTERDLLFEELDYEYALIRNEIIQVRVQKEENQKQMDANNEEMKKIEAENQKLIEMNTRRDDDNKKLSTQLDEALECLKKLEEVRYTMNRLMGPKGVLEDHERYKLLLTKGEYDDEVKAQEGEQQAIEAGNANKNMLGANNDYFYNDARGGAQPGNPVVNQADDDFWYGEDQQNVPLANNEYQSFIAGGGAK